ncbi:MAG TPA: hypothetical protein VJV03_03265 [Pyrinomonadaceae bacterium]|nr:hypothetical protein [Pyrinomonadaceae bacterium]
MRELNRKRVQKWEALAGVCCFVAGILAPLFGMVLLISEWLAGVTLISWLHGVGTALLIAGIPLVLFAGFCLDWAEAKPKPRNSDREGNNRTVQRVVHLVTMVGLCCAASLAQGQQTIFNVPSTDVLDRGQVYLELDASLKPTPGDKVSKFSSFVPRVVVGVGNGIEAGLNVTGNIQPGSDSTTLVATTKWRPLQARESGWAFVVGDHLFLPVRNRTYSAGNYVYAQVSKTFDSGSRITFGGYDFTPNVVAPANRAGGQFGFEHPVGKQLTLAADWLTGKHSSGYFTPGVIFKIGPAVTGYASYSVGNTNAANGNHCFLLELGYNVN